MGPKIFIKPYGSLPLSKLNFKDTVVSSFRKRVHYKLLRKIWKAIVLNDYAFESEINKAKALEQVCQLKFALTFNEVY